MLSPALLLTHNQAKNIVLFASAVADAGKKRLRSGSPTLIRPLASLCFSLFLDLSLSLQLPFPIMADISKSDLGKVDNQQDSTVVSQGQKSSSQRVSGLPDVGNASGKAPLRPASVFSRIRLRNQQRPFTHPLGCERTGADVIVDFQGSDDP